MNELDSRGFTLIELIATIVLLALVMGIGAYSITSIISASKKKDYDLLIENINNAVELYYQECRFVNKNCVSELTLGDLVSGGYLKGNSTNTDDTFMIMNPNDSVDISNCKIKYTYNDGKITVEAVNPSGSCPTSY